MGITSLQPVIHNHEGHQALGYYFLPARKFYSAPFSRTSFDA